MNNQLHLHHEITLLALNDLKGTFAGGMSIYCVAGAMVSELLLQEKIDASSDKQQIVRVIDSESSGDEILDELISDIRSSPKPKSLKDWVFHASRIPKLQHRIADQLCDMGILHHDEKKILWLFTQHVYPELDGTAENQLRDRMANVMFDEKVKPDARTAVLISLAHHASLLNNNFVKDELQQHQERIKSLADGDILATGATKSAIDAVQAAIMVATIIPAFTASVSTSH